jgi:alpha-beta hydrolase superfamily lysophospholipase
MFPYAAEKLSAHGLDAVTFNFSHNGVGENPHEFTELEKFAKNTYSRELEDLDKLIGTVRENKLFPADGKPLFLLGHSRGAGVSLIHAFDHPGDIAGVISWNGIAAVDIFSKENKDEMRTKGRTYTLNARTKQNMPLDKEILDDMERNKERFDIVERIKNAAVPIVLIQGTDDHQRLKEGSAKLAAANPAVQWIQVPGGNHTFNAVHPFQGETEPLRLAIEHTKAFVDRVLESAGSR